LRDVWARMGHQGPCTVVAYVVVMVTRNMGMGQP